MGTRGELGFRLKGKEYLNYWNWDMYVTGMGMEFLLHAMQHTREHLTSLVENAVVGPKDDNDMDYDWEPHLKFQLEGAHGGWVYDPWTDYGNKMIIDLDDWTFEMEGESLSLDEWGPAFFHKMQELMDRLHGLESQGPGFVDKAVQNCIESGLWPWEA